VLDMNLHWHWPADPQPELKRPLELPCRQTNAVCIHSLHLQNIVENLVGRPNRPVSIPILPKMQSSTLDHRAKPMLTRI
jgi:hypothetical protein